MRISMRNRRRTIAAIGLAVSLSITPMAYASEQAGTNGSEFNLPSAEETLKALMDQIETDAEQLPASDLIVPGDSTSDWLIFDCGLLGHTEQSGYWLDRCEQYVTEQYESGNGLDRVKATEWHRLSLAILAMGGDPTAFGTDAEGNIVDLIEDGTYGWTQTDSLGTQGINAWIYALNALDAGQTEIPDQALYSREDMLLEILQNQTDGAFGLVPGEADVDLTAMALQALARYTELDTVFDLEDGRTETVSDSIDAALEWLSGQMTEDGFFESYGAENSESSAQVLIALYSLGIDPQQDVRFQTQDGNVLLAFQEFLLEDGTFCHQKEEGSDIMATEQAIRALYAKECYESGDATIYEVSKHSKQTVADQETDGTQKNTHGSAGSEKYMQFLRGHSRAFWIVLILMLIAFAAGATTIIKKGGKRDYV